jgi:hypothetical protein
VKYWEIIADNLKKAGWSWGCVSAIDSQGRTIWIVDAHRGDGKRFVVRADEKLTAFLELQRATRESFRFLIETHAHAGAVQEHRLKTGNKSQPSPGDRLCKSELHLGSRAKWQCAGSMSIPRLSPRRYWEGRLDGVRLYRHIASIHRNPR